MDRESKNRKDSLYLMVLGTAVFLLLGFALEQAAPVSTADFRLMYYSARCVLSGHDPYLEKNLRQTYREEGGETAQEGSIAQQTASQYIYLPTAFSVTIPFAVVPFAISQFLWLSLTAGSTILAAFLMWEVSVQWAPLAAGLLIAFTLANCELLVAVAGPAGIAIGLCVIAAWCFIRERFELLGVCLLSVSLILKPHDSGLVWLFFLLAGGVYRRRALQALAAVVGLSIPSITWTSYVAPHWTKEVLSSVAANSAHGALNDPGISSGAGHGIAMIISLQTMFSYFYDSPSFYNRASYLVCGCLLVVWMVRVFRISPRAEGAWLALAPVAALSMLPVYHRLDDAKLLLLVIPACSMLCARYRRLGNQALVVTAAQIVFTCALPWALFFAVIKRMPPPGTEFGRQLLIAVQVMPAPAILLITAIFYLRMFIRSEQMGTVPNREGGNL